MIIVYAIVVTAIVLGLLVTVNKQRPKVAESLLKIDGEGGKVKSLEYALFATAICAWMIAVFLMIDGHIFGDSTTGIAAISFIVSLGCWTTFYNIFTFKRRFRGQV